MNKQMTAVEWLIDKIYFKQLQINRELLDQALELEKKQIIDAYIQGSDDLEKSEYLPFKYYNETFNK